MILRPRSTCLAILKFILEERVKRLRLALLRAYPDQYIRASLPTLVLPIKSTRTLL